MLISPPGRTECGFSGVTGKVLRFYTPAPFDILLEQCRLLAGHGRWDRAPEHRPITPLLLRTVARNRDGSVDVAQAKRLFDAAAREQRFERIEEFEATAMSISKRITGFRSEIVFAGGKISSHAEQIFAPFTAIPALMESFRAEIAKDHSAIDTTSLAAIIGFYCIHVHPFVDGNGRWTRIVAVSAGRRKGDPFSAALNAAFLTSCSSELIHQVWPHTKVTNLGNYLELSQNFDDSVRGAPEWPELVDSFLWFDQKLRQLLKNGSRYNSVAQELYSESSIDLEHLRQQAGVSRRVIDGFTDAAVTDRTSVANVRNRLLSLQAIFERVTKVIEFAKHKTFNGDTWK